MAISEYWHTQIEAWQSSGLTQAEYCRQHELNSSTFRSQLGEFRRQANEAPPKFIPVQVQSLVEIGQQDRPIVLHCSGSYRLELPGTVSAAWLSELLRRLG